MIAVITGDIIASRYNLLLYLFFIASLSCNKTFECQCNIGHPANMEIENKTKKEAKEYCENINFTDQLGNEISGNCKLK